MFANLLGWIADTLRDLGFLARKEARIIFVGLDNAGKSTLLRVLKEGRIAALQPTVHPNAEELIFGKLRIKAFDIGGHLTARRLWRDYYANVNGMVFVVDAADRTRFVEAEEELRNLLDDPCLARVPIAVLGNKIDIPVAASEEELRSSLGLYTHMTCGRDLKKCDESVRPVELFMVSLVKKMGHVEALRWLSEQM